MNQDTKKVSRETELLLLMAEETLAQLYIRLHDPRTSSQERERVLMSLSALGVQYIPERVRL